uniref:Secreted protein n=1 Tax=Taenia asiatica TaxID=60517 RepID=A0A0R3VTK8_TAEAS
MSKSISLYFVKLLLCRFSTRWILLPFVTHLIPEFVQQRCLYLEICHNHSLLVRKLIRRI